jgi:hypothetical protein
LSKINGGYYIKARCIQESEIQHAPPHVREIWDLFMMKANHSSHKRSGHVLERGQVLCTYSDIQEALHWNIGWRKKTYSKGDCETAMKWLKKRVMVTTKKTTRGMIVTICNYEKFQNPKNYETYTETYNEPTMNLQTDDTIDKKKKKKKNVKKDIYGEFKNVKLSTDECLKLVDKFGKVGTRERVEALSEGIESKGYKYSSHYATILSWDRKANKEQLASQGGVETGGGYDSPRTEIR